MEGAGPVLDKYQTDFTNLLEAELEKAQREVKEFQANPAMKAAQVSVEVTNSLANHIAPLAPALERIAKALVCSQVPFLRGLQLTLSRKLWWIGFPIVAILSFPGPAGTFARSSTVLLLQFPGFQPKILQPDFVSSPVVLPCPRWLRKLSLLVLSNLRLCRKPWLC